MEFEEIVETFKVFKKLHTANNGKEKTVFYRDLKARKGIMSIVNFDDTIDIFKTELISHMSVNNWDGLLIQYDSLDGRRLYPYKLTSIKSIAIELK